MPDILSYAFNTFLSVFVIIDPFSVVPIYLTLTERFTAEENRHTRLKSTAIALGILLSFAFFGTAIFNFFGITLPAFQIAGGILLLLMGVDQLRASPRRVQPEEETEGLHRDDISVFPMATPLLAGPGAISTVVLQGGKAVSAGREGVLALAIIAAMFASYTVLRFAPYLFRALGQTGLNLMSRLMGMILVAISVQYIITGLSEAFRFGP